MLRRTLRAAGRDLADIKAAHRAAGNVVRGRATGTAPRRTGRLAGTIRVGATATSAYVRAGRASVPYAGPIHWGWPRRGIAPQPWLSEAATDTETVWIYFYEKEIQNALRKVHGT